MGVILKGNGSNDSRNIYINNQPYNVLVQKYGEEAEISGLSVANYVLDYDLNNPNTIPVLDVKYANMINDSIQDSGLLANRTPCDDDNPDTIQDYYEDGICVGHYSYSCEDGEGVTKDELITLINNDEDVTAVCTSNITDMSSLFSGNLDFNQDISSWDVSNVTTMSHMFDYLSLFNQPLNNWDVSNVTDMSYMFYKTDDFNQDISSWNVYNVTNMKAMFLYSYDFNQPLDNWNVSNVNNMRSMFYGSYAFNQSLNDWDVFNITDMSYMFYNANSMNSDISSWNPMNVTDMSSMFYSADNFNQDISSWNVPLIDEEPTNFDYDTSSDWLDSMKPVW